MGDWRDSSVKSSIRPIPIVDTTALDSIISVSCTICHLDMYKCKLEVSLLVKLIEY